jgi:MFS family permease
VNFLKTFETLDSTSAKNLLLLFSVGLLFWTSITTLLPTLPAYIEDIGGTTQEVGIVMGCFAIGLLLSRTWLGNLADRRSRQLVVLIGTLVGGTAPLGYLLVQAIAPLMVIRAFHGISIAAFTTGYSALVVDLSPVKQRGELLGYMSLAVPIGMAVGPALGGFLHESWGYKPLFAISAALGLLAAILATQIREADPEQISTQGQKTVPQTRSFWELAIAPSLLVPGLVLLLIGIVFGTLASFLPLFMRVLHLNLNAGWFYTAAAMASFTSRFWSGRASDRHGRGIFITGSLACYALSMLLISFANTPQAFILAAVLEGTGSGILIPMVLALISDRSHAHERGRVFAVCTTGFDLGMAIAGPAIGGLSLFLTYRDLFVLSSLLALLALLLFVSQSGKNFNQSFRFALGKSRDSYALEGQLFPHQQHASKS